MIRVLRLPEIPPNHVILTNGLFQNLNKDKRQQELINKPLYRKLDHHMEQESHKLIVVEYDTRVVTVGTLHKKPIQGNARSIKMMDERRTRYYSPNMAEKLNHFR